MPIIPEIYDKLLDCCKQFLIQFTTLDIIKQFSQRYPNDWNILLGRYVEGGKGCGNHYSVYVYLGQRLKELSAQNRIEYIDHIHAPSNWGYETIALYRNKS